MDLHKSNNITSIVSAFVSLATFAFAFKCSLLLPYLTRVEEIYNMMMADVIIDMNPEELKNYTAKKIVNTPIVSGFLCELLLETPSVPNGPIFLYHYLASITIKTNSSDVVRLRNPNEI